MKATSQIINLLDDPPIDDIDPVIFDSVHFQHMLIHTGAVNELHLAHRTRVVLLLGMLPSVALELSLRIARQLAKITLEQPFTGVPSQMSLQTLLHIRPVIAQIAHVLPLGLVHPRMIQQIDVSDERSAASLTTVILHIHMPVQMTFQSLPRLEFFTADRA